MRQHAVDSGTRVDNFRLIKLFPARDVILQFQLFNLFVGFQIPVCFEFTFNEEFGDFIDEFTKAARGLIVVEGQRCVGLFLNGFKNQQFRIADTLGLGQESCVKMRQAIQLKNIHFARILFPEILLQLAVGNFHFVEYFEQDIDTLVCTFSRSLLFLFELFWTHFFVLAIFDMFVGILVLIGFALACIQHQDRHLHVEPIRNLHQSHITTNRMHRGNAYTCFLCHKVIHDNRLEQLLRRRVDSADPPISHLHTAHNHEICNIRIDVILNVFVVVKWIFQKLSKILYIFFVDDAVIVQVHLV
mmetsp:Transcript_31353/g.50654  ORF Transcript_31353/g.50654 Transcript_31353/m.50654 type:complete len:301 (-) Transcript_31353:47-949(-)